MVREPRLRGRQLHGARLPRHRVDPGLDRPDPARLAPVRDQRLPVAGGSDRRRPVLRRQPAEDRHHRGLVWWRLRLAGAHRPNLEQPGRKGHEAGGDRSPVRMDGSRLLTDPERAPVARPEPAAGVRRLRLDPAIRHPEAKRQLCAVLHGAVRHHLPGVGDPVVQLSQRD